MMPRGRVNAHQVNGAVVITVDPITAVDMAVAYAEKCRLDHDYAAARGQWEADVTTIVNAATMASAQAQRVDVPVLRLAAVGGELRD